MGNVCSWLNTRVIPCYPSPQTNPTPNEKHCLDIIVTGVTTQVIKKLSINTTNIREIIFELPVVQVKDAVNEEYLAYEDFILMEDPDYETLSKFSLEMTQSLATAEFLRSKSSSQEASTSKSDEKSLEGVQSLKSTSASSG